MFCHTGRPSGNFFFKQVCNLFKSNVRSVTIRTEGPKDAENKGKDPNLLSQVGFQSLTREIPLCHPYGILQITSKRPILHGIQSFFGPFVLKIECERLSVALAQPSLSHFCFLSRCGGVDLLSQIRDYALDKLYVQLMMGYGKISCI
jgi:hypothetical protein